MFQFTLKLGVTRGHDYRNWTGSVAEHRPRMFMGLGSRDQPQHHKRQTKFTQLNKVEGYEIERPGISKQHHAQEKSQLPGNCWAFRNW